MWELKRPKRLRPGDTVATISISGGRAGDPDMLDRYLLGKRRLEETFGLHIVETSHSLKGDDFIYRHPRERVQDLMGALADPDIKGIIANMGGDDSYRLLPYMDYGVIVRKFLWAIPIFPPLTICLPRREFLPSMDRIC